MYNKILIVEDELIAAEYLKEVLQNNGFEVISVVDTAEEALHVAATLCVDIVLMDILLAGPMSGSEAALKMHQKFPQIAIIFLTAYSDTQSIDYAIGAHAYGYLMKPYNEDEIVSTLKVLSAKLAHERGSINTCSNHLVRIEPTLYYDKKLKKLLRDAQEIALSNKALLFIDLLCQTPNISVSNEQIAQSIWNEHKNATTLRTLVHRIRQQLDSDIIVNVNALGYMIRTKDDEG